MIKTLQNFYKTTILTACGLTVGNIYVSDLPTQTTGFLVINPKDVSKREIIEYNAKGTDGGGNYVYANQRGLGGTTAQVHAVNEAVRMNLTAEHWTEVKASVDGAVQKAGDTMTGLLTLSGAPTADLHAATKKYADDLAIAGAPDASVTIKGIAKLSVTPAVPTDPIAVGVNDGRMPSQDENDALAGTSGTPSTTNKYVTNDDTAIVSAVSKVVRANTSGKIDDSFMSNAIKFAVPAGETLATGNFLKMFNNGKAIKIRGMGAGSYINDVTGASKYIKQAVQVADNKFVICYMLSSTPAVFSLQAFSVSGQIITAGTSVDVDATSGINNSGNVCLEVVDTDKVVIGWTETDAAPTTTSVRAKIYTLAGLVLTGGTTLNVKNTAFDSSTNTNYFAASIKKIDTDKLIYSYFCNDGSYKDFAIILTVSGTSLSAGAEILVESAISWAYLPIAITILSTTKALISYGHTANYLTAVIATVSGTTINLGTKYNVITIGSNGWKSLNAVTVNGGNQVILCYQDPTLLTTLYYSLLTISGTTITGTNYSIASILNNVEQGLSALIDNNKYYIYSSGYKKVWKFFVDGVNIVFKKAYTLTFPNIDSQQFCKNLLVLDTVNQRGVFWNASYLAPGYGSQAVFGFVDWDEITGIADKAYVLDETVNIKIRTGGRTGLAIGNNYGINYDASNVIMDDVSYQKIGKAITTTELCLE